MGHDAVWVSSEVLPSFACFLTEAALLPAPKWGVSVGGVSGFHFLDGWRLSYSWLLSAGRRGREGQQNVSLSASHPEHLAGA